MTPAQPTLASGHLDEALAAALEHTSDPWRRKALQVIRELAETGYPFEAFDLVTHGVPEPDHPARWGALFHHAAKKGLIELAPNSAGPSRRPTVNRSLVRYWIGTATVSGVR